MIGELRQQLIHDLETGSDGNAPPIGVRVYDLWPDKIAPPCAVIGIEPGQYITGGQTYGNSYEIRLIVVLLTPRSATSTADLEGLIERTLMNTVDWGMSSVDPPSVFTESGQESVGTIVHLNKQTKLV